MAQKIIDTHFHIWNRQQLQLDWLSAFPGINRDYSYEDFIEAISGFEVEQAIYVEVNVAAHDRYKEVASITELCRDPKTIVSGLVADIDLCDAGAPQLLSTYVNNPAVKGVRCVLWPDSYPDSLSLPAIAQENLDKIAASQLPFEVCVRPTQLASVIDLVAAHPKCTFILEHGCGLSLPTDGNIDQSWCSVISALAGHQNTLLKFSGLMNFERLTSDQVSLLEQAFLFCWQAFGVDRMLFGGNWPVSTLSIDYAFWVETLMSCLKNHSNEDRDAFFRCNALRVYDLATTD